MKTYPYQTPNGIIELVEKREYDKLHEERNELWQEIAAAKHGDSGYAVLQANHEKQIAELIVRLRERTESHLAASARDVQTIQRQSILLERMADALRAINSLEGDELIPSGDVWSDASVAAFHQSLTALSAYESANLDLVNPIDEAVKRMEAASIEQLRNDYWQGMQAVELDKAIGRVRARLIQAAKGES